MVSPQFFLLVLRTMASVTAFICLLCTFISVKRVANCPEWALFYLLTAGVQVITRVIMICKPSVAGTIYMDVGLVLAAVFFAYGSYQLYCIFTSTL